jgi:hypothetical protein
MIEYLPQALSALSTALNLGKSLVEIRDSAKLQEAVIQFNSAIIDAQSKIMYSQNEQAALKAKINELEEECERLKNWETEREKYTRTEIASGVFVYIENNYVGKFQNAHKYCCNCFDNYKKSILQQFHITKGRKIGLSCHNKCPDLVFRYYIDVT